jgi:hypothetical protein
MNSTAKKHIISNTAMSLESKLDAFKASVPFVAPKLVNEAASVKALTIRPNRFRGNRNCEFRNYQ